MKRMLILIALLCLVISISGCSSSNEPFDSESLQSYKDIPGVTKEEISLIENLKESRDSFFYGHLIQTEAFLLPDGTYEGFTIRFAELLTELFGIEFIPRPYDDWEYLKTDLDSLKTDFIGGLTATPERMDYYYMTHSIAERSLKIYYHVDTPDFMSESDVNDKKIGFFTGTINYEYVKKRYPTLTFEVIDLDNLVLAVEKIETGEIDAFITDAVYDPAVEGYDFIKSRELFSLVYTPVSMSTANPELEPIISVMNKYISAGGIDKLHELYEDGNYEYAKYKLYKSFTNEEKAYLGKLSEQGQVMNIGFETDNYPFSFYNDKDKEFQGIAIDVLSEISRLIDIRFKPENTEEAEWTELLDKLGTGEILMITQLMQTKERENDFIWSGIPYATSQYALISKMDYPYIQPYQVVRTKVGTVDNTGYAEIYPLWFPNNDNLVFYGSHIEAFAALENGDVDMVMATDYMLYYQTNYLEKPYYKINISFDTKLNSYFGFHKKETVLCSIIDKTMNYVRVDSIESEWKSKVFDYSEKMANERSVYLMVLVLFLVCALIAVLVLLFNTKKAKEEARTASKVKSSFLAHMSHEIRTPLNAIIGMANIAKGSISDEEKTIKSIHQIISSSHHLLNVLNNILDMSKIESGKLELSCDPFSLIEACDSVSSMIANRCLEKKINFVTNINEMEDVTLLGDRLRINQVLINLLGNAVKFTDNEGEIKLELNMREEDGDGVRIEYVVTDNGTGIAKEQIEKLFVPFEQTDSSISAKYGGTGLGLSISQNLVNMMGGVIKVKSELNRGSIFYFDLYFKKGERKKAASLEETGSLDLDGKRLLLVEDIEINYEIVKEILSPTGVLIDVATDGKQAVDALADSPAYHYDLIFMDIQMPVMNGYEATKEIRRMAREDAKKIPIIAMTANAYKEDADQSIKAGMDGHLSKPVDITAIMNTLKKFLAN